MYQDWLVHYEDICANCVIFTSTCHTKQLNPWLKSSVSHVVIHSQLSEIETCLLIKGNEAIIMKTIQAFVDVWHTSETCTARAAWVTFSTDTWLNGYLMCTAIFWWWKVGMSIVCEEGGFFQIQSYTPLH